MYNSFTSTSGKSDPLLQSNLNTLSFLTIIVDHFNLTRSLFGLVVPCCVVFSLFSKFLQHLLHSCCADRIVFSFQCSHVTPLTLMAVTMWSKRRLYHTLRDFCFLLFKAALHQVQHSCHWFKKWMKWRFYNRNISLTHTVCLTSKLILEKALSYCISVSNRKNPSSTVW